MGYSFHDIGGYEPQKLEAKRIVNFFRNYDKFTQNGASLPKGIIFYGMPGTGKTLFANAIADDPSVDYSAMIANTTKMDFVFGNEKQLTKSEKLTKVDEFIN